MTGRPKAADKAERVKAQRWWDFHQALLRCSTLTDAQHRVLGVLFSYANGPQHPRPLDSSRPGVALIVEATGYARSTVQRALRDLEKDRWIYPTKEGGHGKGGRGKATTYRLTVPLIPSGQGPTGDETAPPAGPFDTQKGPSSRTVSTTKGPTSGVKTAPPAGPRVPHQPGPTYASPIQDLSNQASSSTISPASVAENADCLIEDESANEEQGEPMSYDERDQEPSAEQLRQLDEIQATESVLSTPAYLADLVNPIGGWDAHDDDQHPQDDPDHTALHWAASDTTEAATTAPAAALDRIRTNGCPARLTNMLGSFGGGEDW